MAENKKSIIVYADWDEYFEDLTNEEAGILIKHFFDYVNDRDPVLTDRLLIQSFKPIKAALKRDLKKWETIKEKRSEAGRIGGINSGKSRSSKQNEANEANALNSKQTKQDKANEAVNVNVNEINNNRSKKFDQFNFSREFEIFWSKYPNKVGKKDTQKKFSKLNKDQVKKILETIDAFVSHKQFETYTHPNPQTYINQERWNDELPEKKKFEHGYTPQMPN